jgi:N-acetylglucosamine transport system permease protein
VWTEFHVSTYFANSLIVTAGGTLLGLILAAMTAYVLARYSFRGSKALYLLYIASMMVPFNLALIPLFFLMNSMNLVNTQLGLILIYASSVLAFGIFVLIGFFKSLPRDLEEAAVMDGASHFGTFFRIMLPLSQPGLITIMIVNVLGIWNEYIVGLTVTTDPGHYTLPVGIAVLQTEMQYRTEWGPLFAALMFTIVPVLVVYIVFQRQIAIGMTAGAVK